MKKLLLASLIMFLPAMTSFGFDDEAEYTCGFFVCHPGVDIIYFSEDGDSASRTYWHAVKTCEYNRGGKFGLEICEEVACIDNSDNGSRCNNLFVPGQE